MDDCDILGISSALGFNFVNGSVNRRWNLIHCGCSERASIVSTEIDFALWRVVGASRTELSAIERLLHLGGSHLRETEGFGILINIAGDIRRSLFVQTRIQRGVFGRIN